MQSIDSPGKSTYLIIARRDSKILYADTHLSYTSTQMHQLTLLQNVPQNLRLKPKQNRRWVLEASSVLLQPCFSSVGTTFASLPDLLSDSFEFCEREAFRTAILEAIMQKLSKKVQKSVDLIVEDLERHLRTMQTK